MDLMTKDADIKTMVQTMALSYHKKIANLCKTDHGHFRFLMSLRHAHY